MSTKTVLKFGIAFALLAIVLIFLGVNFVPRTTASLQGNSADSIKPARPDYANELYPRSIVSKLTFAGTDSFASHLQASASRLSFAGTDALATHLQGGDLQLSFRGTDAYLSHLQSSASQPSFTGTDAFITHMQSVASQITLTGTAVP